MDEQAGADAGPVARPEARWLVWAAAALYVVTISWLSHYRYTHYWTLSYDQAICEQALHQLLRGSDVVSVCHTRFLGVHLYLTHLVFLPLAWASPACLFLAQSASVAAAALALLRFGVGRRLQPWAGSLFAVAYLSNPLVQFPNLFDYHPDLLGVGPLAWALVWLQQRRWWPYLACLVALSATKETFGLVVAALAALAALEGAERRYWLAPLLLGPAAFAGGVLLVSSLNVNGSTLVQHHAPLGASIVEMVLHCLTRPVETLRYLWTASRGEALLLLLAGFVFLPLGAPRWLLAAAPLVGVQMLAAPANLHSVRYHYYALPLVALAFAAVDAASRRGARWQLGLAGATLAASAALHLVASPVLELPCWRHRRAELVRKRELDAAVGAVPPRVGVAAPIGLVAHFARHERLYVSDYALGGFNRHITADAALDPEVSWFLHDAPRISHGPYRGATVASWLARWGTWEQVRAGPHLWAYRRTGPAPLLAPGSDGGARAR